MAERKVNTSAPETILGTSESEVSEYKDAYVLRAESADDELLLPSPTGANIEEATIFVVRGDDGSSGHEARVRSESFRIKMPLGRDRNAYKLGGFEVVRLYVLNARWYILGRSNLTRLGSIGKVTPIESSTPDAAEPVVSDLENLRRAVNQLIERARRQGMAEAPGRLDSDFRDPGSILTTAAV